MDPASIIGILGSVVSIGDVVSKSIQRLTELRNTYRNAPLMATMLIGQLHIIQSALDRLSSIWNSQAVGRNPRYRQLALQMGTALESFGPLMLSLQTKLHDMHVEGENMSTKDKLSFLWNEKEMGDFFTLVDRQVNALNLLLQAIQCNTWAEQQRMIDDNDSQNVLQLARDCSSSIVGALDRESMVTENTDGMSTNFAFDALILGCRPYLSAHRSNLRQVVRLMRPKASADGLEVADLESIFSLDDLNDSADQVDTLTVRSITSRFIHVDDEADKGWLLADIRLPLIAQLVKTLEEIAATKEITTNEIEKEIAREIAKAANRPLRQKTNGGFWNAIRPRSQQSQTIRESKELKQDPRKEVKIMFLGTSESGKSMLLKGLKLLTEGNYADDEAVLFKEIIFSNLVQGCRVVLEAMESLELSLSNQRNEYHVQTIFMQSPQPEYEHLPPEVSAAIKALWRDGGFQTCYKRRREYQMNDSYEYYVNSIERVERPDYLPSMEDVLRHRVKTTGITETVFDIFNLRLHCFDVGGTRSERKKWIHCFDNVDLIMFTLDPTAYDRVLFEDETVNRVQEMLTLFDSIVNSRWFTKTKFILVFSKMDLLEQRLTASHPAVYFPDLQPGFDQRTPTVNEYMTYLEERFVSLAQSPERRDAIRVVYANLADINMWRSESYGLNLSAGQIGLAN